MVLPSRTPDQSRPEGRDEPARGRTAARSRAGSVVVSPAGQPAAQVSAGVPAVPDDEPMNPNDVPAPGASAPFQDTLRAVRVDPLPLSVAFHAWVTPAPAGRASVTVHPVSAAAPATTVTSPW